MTKNTADQAKSAFAKIRKDMESKGLYPTERDENVFILGYQVRCNEELDEKIKKMENNQ